MKSLHTCSWINSCQKTTIADYQTIMEAVAVNINKVTIVFSGKGL